MENVTVSRILGEMADLCEVRGDNPFKIRALRGASETVASLPFALEPLCDDPKKLRGIQGIGAGIAAKIVELRDTGAVSEHQELLAEFPVTLLELLELEGVGPKKVRLFHENLGVQTVSDLEAAARAGRVRDLPRMSAASEQKLLKAITAYKARSGRFLLSWAEPVVSEILLLLRGLSGVSNVEAAGSFRRRRETVGDLDFLVCVEKAAAKKPAVIMDPFSELGEVIARGDTKCSVKLPGALQADLRLIPAESFGAALQYFTGSKAHNVALRTLAVNRKLSINEYGVFRAGPDGRQGKRVGGATEEEIYRALDMAWIPPELRENRGEIEAAAEGRLPRLLELDDLRGDVHMHTTETDGSASVEEMARAAITRGRSYIAIADHSKALAMTGGLDEKRLAAQGRVIDRVNASLGDRIRVLRGIEVDILRDGQLDLKEDALRRLDVVVASVHSHFNLSRDEMTTRIVRAMGSGCVDIVAHPTGRLLLRREPYALDMEAIMKAAAIHGVALELNAFPDRLDLSDTHCRMAREHGVKVVISTDSHTTEHLGLLRFGVGQARRGWLRAADVLNTLEVDAFLEKLHAGHR